MQRNEYTRQNGASTLNLKGIYNVLTVRRYPQVVVSTPNLKGIYNTCFLSLLGLMDVSTHNLKGIYNRNPHLW
jgi:hypothetical protein